MRDCLLDQSNIEQQQTTKYGLTFDSPMKWLVLVVDSLEGVRELEASSLDLLKSMNLIVLLISASTGAENSQTKQDLNFLRYARRKRDQGGEFTTL